MVFSHRPLSLAIAALFGLALLANEGAAATRAKSKIVESSEMTVGAANIAYKFAIETAFSDYYGEFYRLKITNSKGQTWTFSPDGGLAPYEDQVDKGVLDHNILNSKYVYMSSNLRDSLGAPLAIIFGQAFQSDPPAMRVFRLTDKGVETVVSKNFVLMKIENGGTTLIGRDELGEGTGEEGCGETYTPYAVYKLAATPHSKFQYSLKLSKAYNIKNYAGWLDHPTDDIYVDTCKKGGLGEFVKRK